MPENYVHELKDKIRDHKVAAAWLARQTGIDRKIINEWIREDRPTQYPKVPEENEAKLAAALGGDVAWDEWRDLRPHLTPTSLDRKDTAAAFLARKQAAQQKGADVDAADGDDRPYVVVRDVETLAGGRQYIAAALDQSRWEGRRDRINHPALQENDDIILDVIVNVRPTDDDESDDCELGVTQVHVSLTVADGCRGRFAANFPADKAGGTPWTEAALLYRDGTPDSVNAVFWTRERKLLRLNGLHGPPVEMGEFRGSRIGDRFQVSVRVPAERFVSQLRDDAAVSDARPNARLNRQKLRALLKKWNLRIPCEAVDIEVFRTTYQVRDSEES